MMDFAALFGENEMRGRVKFNDFSLSVTFGSDGHLEREKQSSHSFGKTGTLLLTF